MGRVLEIEYEDGRRILWRVVGGEADFHDEELDRMLVQPGFCVIKRSDRLGTVVSLVRFEDVRAFRIRKRTWRDRFRRLY